MPTKQQIDTLIDTNLANGSNITPSEHRAVEHTIVDYVDQQDAALQAAINGKQPAGDYATNSALTSGLAGKAATAHTHAIADVTGLQAALDAKAASTHNHDDRYYTETETDTLLAGKANASHTQAATTITEDTTHRFVTDTEKATWNAKQAAGDYATNTALTSGLAGKAATSHTHAAADITGTKTSAFISDFNTSVDARIPAEVFAISCSDLTTALTTGTTKASFRMPYSGTLTGVRLSVITAPNGSAIIVNVKEAGTTLFSTKPSIAIGAKTSVGGTAAVISDSSLADDAEITIDIDQVGSTIAGAGLVVYLYITKS